MKNGKLLRKSLALVLSAVLALGTFVPAGAVGADSSSATSLDFSKTDKSLSPRLNQSVSAETEETSYDKDESVRVSIVLEAPSTIEAGFSTMDIAANAAAVSYRETLKDQQAKLISEIEADALDDGTLDVVWNMTLAANMISANVKYGQIKAIEAVDGVKEVVLEAKYEPCVVDREETADPSMATSSAMIGSTAAWADGYTGAGSRIAVIDTGIDTDHQSFDAGAYEYVLSKEAEKANMSLEDYKASLNLLDADKIAAVAGQLNIKANPKDLYLTGKIPYAYNYVDENLVVDHDHDSQGEHGSHVEGIAAANAYIPAEDGTYTSALDSVFVQGVAPNAQILTMKVFGASGGAYDSDYMVAIEDAIILGADSVNLSLGSASAGFSRSTKYQDILDSLQNTDTVVTISAGNSYNWAKYASNGVPYLYSEDVNLDTVGSPGSFTNSLAVASVDNDGFTGDYLKVGDSMIFYTQTSYKNEPMTTIAGEQSYVFIDGFGTADEFAAIKDVLAGKIAVCSRGTTSFYEKAEAAAANGAIATVIYNNQAGTINMDLSSYTKTAPVVSVTQADGKFLKDNAEAVKDESGNVLYYLGKLTVGNTLGTVNYNSDYYTMSDYSSTGVPGSLIMKPEITAPGGNIYSVNGAVAGGKAYESMSGTSMAAPQVAGMAALVAQYIRENGFAEKAGVKNRTLTQSLLMSTAKPLYEEESGSYWSILKQGAGLANVGSAVTANSYITMAESATASAADGKVKAELGDDPDRTGDYSYTFTIHNLDGKAKNYTLRSDFFTQDVFAYGDYTYMDTCTAALSANVTYTVDGTTFVPTSKISADVDKDGDTDADDAQAILDYLVGNRKGDELDLTAADVDGNGDVTTYDAHLLLAGLQTAAFTVPADGSVTVTVHAALTDAQKEYLNANYPNGTYVEGYTYVEPVSSTEGETPDVTHSIPVLGFYGNWSDPSMYDKGTYAASLCGEQKPSYLGATKTNNLVVKYQGDNDGYYVIGNPYAVEDSFPADKLAISGSSTLYQYKLSLIRNAAAIMAVVTNEAGDVVYATPASEQAAGAYYYQNQSKWMGTASAFTMNKRVATLGVKENEKLTVSVVAVPEYYETDGTITQEQLKELITSGKLGKGAFLSTTMTVDNTAPELLTVNKDLLTGNLTIEAKDNQYLAYVAVLNKSGTKVLAGTVPTQETAGEAVSTAIDLTGVEVGTKCTILVADYAGNEAAYTVEYGGEEPDYTGRMFGFTNGSTFQGTTKRWVEVDPENVFFYYKSGDYAYGGLTDVATTPLNVCAAEYVDGYVYMAADDGYLYVAPQDELDNYEKVGNFGDLTIVGMAMNYADGKLYAMGQANGDSTNYEMTIYTVDLITGKFDAQYTVKVINPYSQNKTRTKLSGLAIDDDGNFYTVNYGAAAQTFLYKFKNADAVDGTIADLHPINDTKAGSVGAYGNYSTLAWDHDKDILYMAAICSKSSSSNNLLVTLDTTTGKATKTSTNDGGYGSDIYASQLRLGMRGLYIVPSSGTYVAPTDEATEISVMPTELELLKGVTTKLDVEVYPWTLKDKSVTWTSSDDGIVTVKDGTITTVGIGKAIITATTNAKPGLTATCEVTVKELPDINLSALIYDANSEPHFAEFKAAEPANWTAVSEKVGAYYAGALVGDTLYVHSGDTMFGIDADGFETTSFGTIASSWIWSDAAPAPAFVQNQGLKIIGLCNSGTYIEMINPEAGSLKYFNVSSTFGNDPLAVIALMENGTYLDYPAAYYFAMTESGKLYKLVVYSRDDGETLKIGHQLLGQTDVSLTLISSVTGGTYASLYYANGYLLLSSYQDGEMAQLYAIDPETLLTANLGNFGEKVWPAVALYQYERAKDLTLRLSETALSLYEGDSQQLTVRIRPTTFTGGVTWTSGNNAVATVAADGTVTAVGAGTATITATSVDKNAAGQQVSASAEVTVTALTELNAKLHAEVQTADGAKWVTIDTADLTKMTVDGSASGFFTGAGAHDGKLYATTGDFTSMGKIYQIDPAKGYAETAGSDCSGSYAILDMTTAPSKTSEVTATDGSKVQKQVFGYPIYIANAQSFVMLKDYAEGTLNGWSLASYYNDLAAVAYAGQIPFDYNGVVYDTLQYYVLGADGTLYLFRPYAKSYKDATDSISYSMFRSTVGNIGMSFDNYQTLSMTYLSDGTNTGLLIADNTHGADLYYVDLKDAANGNLSVGKIGKLSGVTGITGLYTDGELATTAASEAITGEVVEEDAVDTTLDELNGAAETFSLNEEDNAITAESGMAAELPAGVKAKTVATADTIRTAKRAVIGSLNAITARADVNGVEKEDVLVDAENHTVTVKIRASETTNGLFQVDYDADVLTLETVTGRALYAANAEESGKVLLDFADAGVINEVVATLVFSYEKADADRTTPVVVTTAEDGEAKPGTKETIDFTLPGEGTDPTDPEPTDPEPTDPTPTDPEPTKPSEEPTKPSEEPTKPSEEPTKPSEEPTKPSEEPTKPSEKPTQPSDGKTPSTGDTSQVFAAAMLAVMSVFAAATMVVVLRKKHSC